MKFIYVVIIIAVLAWPFNYLYQMQLGSIPFLLLGLFFIFMTVRQIKKVKAQKGVNKDKAKREKIKRNKG
jgi:uncharacterized membrane protein YqjE